jgi:hypothetical protein
MSEPKCLITGCVLYVEDQNMCVRGDLYALGNTYIFNSCLNEDNATAWSYRKYYENSDLDKVLVITGNYFEKRGVIVIDNCDAHLNSAANNYLS